MAYLSDPDFKLVRKVLADLQASEPAIDAALRLVDEAQERVASPALRQKASDLYATDDLEIDDEGVGTQTHACTQ